jgi:hypothetical protein
MSVDLNWNLATQQPNMLQLAQQGFETGRAQKMQRVQDEALAKIGANPNDTQAINALLPVNPGLYGQLAGALQQRQQSERQATRQQAIGGALSQLDGLPEPVRMLAQSDPEGAMQLWEMTGKMDAQQASAAKVNAEKLAAVVTGLQQLPPQQRFAEAQRLAPQFGIDPAQITPETMSDAGIQAILTQAMGVKGVLDYRLNVAKFDNQRQQQDFDNQIQTANLGVAQQNLGLRAAEVQNSAAGGLSPKEARRATVELRKQFDGLPEVKAFKELAPVIVSARRAPDTPAGDIQLAYTVGKVLDPNSVVREGELAMVAAAGSPVERILGTTRFVADGKARLTPTQRQQLLGMLNERALANRQAYDAAYTNYAQYATDSGVSPRAVVGTHAANAFRQPQARAAAPQGGAWSIKPKG